jgi:hypothetical protein
VGANGEYAIGFDADVGCVLGEEGSSESKKKSNGYLLLVCLMDAVFR